MADWSEESLLRLFEPYTGQNWLPLPDGQFVVYVPYGVHAPIVLPSEALAERVAAAIEDAHSAGVRDGQIED